MLLCQNAQTFNLEGSLVRRHLIWRAPVQHALAVFSVD